MTPFERALEFMKWWKSSHAGSPIEIVNRLATAFQAQSNEDELRHREKQQALRDLLAQQAKRADEAVARLAQYGSHGHKCCHGQCVDVGPNGPEYNMGCDCGLLDAINEGYPGIAADFEQEKALRRAEWHRANDAEAQRDAALAHAAEMRRALEPFARWAQRLDAPPNWVPDGCPLVASPGDVSDFSVGQLRAARAALALSPGDALERVRREAKAEALEALPCENVKFRGFWRSCINGGFADLCPRCRALDAARKENA